MGAAVAVAALMLFAAGCGGSSSESSSASAETTTSSESTETTSTESSEATTSETTDAAGSTGGATALTGACKDMADLGQKYGEALAQAGSGGDTDLSVTASAFSEFADQVPDEIKADFQTLADALSAYAKAMQGLDLQAGEVPSASEVAKLTEAAQSFSATEVTAASSNITAWVEKNCGTTP
jgi:hypothetical protein